MPRIMTVKEYEAALSLAANAADAALEIGDDDTHIVWGRAYHRLASEALAVHGVELRPE